MSYYETLINSFTEKYSQVHQNDEYYYLYKHFSYGAKDTEYEFKVLDTFYNSSLLFSKPNVFNDPFDCFSIIDYNFDKITRAEMQDIRKERITNKDFKLNKHKYIKDLKAIDVIKHWGDIRRNEFHLTCFNNSPLHILMWSHYAFNHQGFMVEFKFKKTSNKFAGLPIPVIYCNDFPKLKYPYNASAKMCIEDREFGAEMIIKLFSNKAECWSYENEFRLPNTIGELENEKAPVTIDSNLFVSVIFGARTNISNVQETEKAIAQFNEKYNQNIETYHAKMKEDKYELYVPDHPRLDKK